MKYIKLFYIADARRLYFYGTLMRSILLVYFKFYHQFRGCQQDGENSAVKFIFKMKLGQCAPYFLPAGKIRMPRVRLNAN